MRRPGQDGFILVAVLGIMALMASLTGGTALLVRGLFNGAQGAADDLRLEALITAGIELAAYELYELNLPPARITEQTVRLDTGSITLSAADEAGRIDLNWSEPALLEGAYQVSGLTTLQPRDFAARVVQWRERDEPKPATGTPPSGISLAAPPIGRGKDGFRTVDELRWIADVSQEDIAILALLVTVDNVQGRINAAEASADVLSALPEMTPTVVAQVLALRALPNAQTADRIKGLLQKQQNFLTTKGGPSFRVRIRVESGATARRSVLVTLTRAPSRDVPYFVTALSR